MRKTRRVDGERCGEREKKTEIEKVRRIEKGIEKERDIYIRREREREREK